MCCFPVNERLKFFYEVKQKRKKLPGMWFLSLASWESQGQKMLKCSKLDPSKAETFRLWNQSAQPNIQLLQEMCSGSNLWRCASFGIYFKKASNELHTLSWSRFKTNVWSWICIVLIILFFSSNALDFEITFVFLLFLLLMQLISHPKDFDFSRAFQCDGPALMVLDLNMVNVFSVNE